MKECLANWKDYRPGDFVGVEGSGFLTVASYAIFKPPTYLFHFLTIRARLEEEDDYEIIEMRTDGCKIGRLSWYLDHAFVVFRLNDPEVDALGKRAAKYASRFGRAPYDYRLFFKLPFACLKCWLKQLLYEHWLRRIDPAELDISWDTIFVCTELPKAIWLQVSKNAIGPKDVGIPAAYKKSYLAKRIRIVGWNIPKESRVKFLP